ncbi:hypothetical protein SAMN05216378_4232 [Paenibacillus catalpae]|uniref:Uncharacterized protein n=1 Tax=Paenibacillus catalpae TaxID=1045775 RepID=A0A1I2DSR1_9BACL|nr:hypothetical protein [Paenibacillus catalpae]SFE82990.1 hypothetical protein SAMN05216378_4232 [Paenibacillus catalpae]
MSAKFKVKVKSVKRRAKKGARISNCGCSMGDRVGGVESGGNNHRHCDNDHQDPAVEGVQDAGKHLSKVFDNLKNERVAEKLVRAIRDHDAQAVQCLVGCHCRVVDFFRTRNADCVRVRCSFGRYRDVVVSFDICVRRRGVDDISDRQNNNRGCCWF